jgi:Carboxypeptidase regulatory-like domain
MQPKSYNHHPNFIMQNFNVNKLRIASPCSMNWENMSGDERSRFCQSCQLNVYNLSEMSSGEIEKLILQKEGRVCGRLFRRADGTVITKDCPTGLSAMRKRMSRTASAVFATVLSLFSIGLSQKQACDDENDERVVTTRTESKTRSSVIYGKVINSKGMTIPNTKITFTNQKTNKKLKIKTGNNGEFRFRNLSIGLYDLEFSIKGFSSEEILNLEVRKNETLKIKVHLHKSQTDIMIGILQ